MYDLFLPSLDIFTCNSANEQSFQNPTIISLNIQKLQIFAIFASYLASIVVIDVCLSTQLHIVMQAQCSVLYSSVFE